MALSLDGHTLAVVTFIGSGTGNSAGAKVTQWALRKGTKIVTTPRGTRQIAFSPDGRLLAVGGVQFGKATLWNVLVWVGELRGRVCCIKGLFVSWLGVGSGHLQDEQAYIGPRTRRAGW